MRCSIGSSCRLALSPMLQPSVLVLHAETFGVLPCILDLVIALNLGTIITSLIELIKFAKLH
jgi:hypothetical protein